MLTEEYLKDNLITAYFIDVKKENIEMVLKSEDQKNTYVEVTPFDENNEQYKILTKIISLDQIHEITYKRIKEERRLFEKQMIDIAKKEGLILENNKIDTKFFNLLVKIIFEEKSEDKEELFTLKIALFELDKIKNSKNTELKTKLRKAQTIYDTLSVAFELTK
jgi:hypothetical protein